MPDESTRTERLGVTQINSFIWCAVGAAVGFLAAMSFAANDGNKTMMVENVLVGMFGAFIGGDFVATLLNGGVVNNKDFKFSSLLLAAAGAFVLILALKLMRHVVGPMKAGKSKKKPDY